MTEATASQTQPQFNIEKLYVKDLSVEVPHAPEIFLEREAPRIDLQLNTQHSTISEGVFDVTVTAIVTAKLKERVVFLIEAKQSGIFIVRNVPQQEMETVLEVVCPNILYPYLRELVSDSSVRAGFVPALLNPIDFAALHAQKLQAQAEAPVTH
ncbi:MAG TPA: protein-export chaperone SecB [Gallionellaceae bacterium]